MVAAARAGGQLKAPPRVGVARTGSAQVDDRGQVLFLLEVGRADPLARQRSCDAAVQVGGSHLDGVARDDTGVEAVEPARPPVVPGPILHYRVVMDAVAPRVPERAVRDLVHPDRARRRLVDLEGIPGPTPPPVGPGHRIARALDLGQRGQQIGRHDGRGMLAEERPVPPPGLGRRLVERAAHREKHLGGLANHLVHPVHRQYEHQNDGRPRDEPDRQRRGP
jgi:hypothetical protein